MDAHISAGQQVALSSEGKPIRLLIVSDIYFLREAFAAVLERDPMVATIRCADPAEAVALGLAAQADAVLLHTALEDGAAIVRKLREVAPSTPIVAGPVREKPEEVIAWAEAGATGYLPNTTELGECVRTLRDILAGQQFCSGRVAAGLLRRVAMAATLGVRGEGASSARGLTRRERQVAELIAAGLTDKEIARRLNVSVATTKSHVHNLLGKLNVEHRGYVVDMLRGQHPS